MGESGGLVEIDDRGNVVRSASSADPAFPRALLTPYGLVVMPGIDRVVSTNSSMQESRYLQRRDVSGVASLRSQAARDVVPRCRRGSVRPYQSREPRLGPDGSVLIQTLGCGLERVTDISASPPKAQLVYWFPGQLVRGAHSCRTFTWFRALPAIHGFIVLDIANGGKTRGGVANYPERHFFPHWSAWDPETQRLVATSGSTPPDNRLYLLKLRPSDGRHHG